MIRKLEYCSEHLKSLRRQLADFRHGGIVLQSDMVEDIVQRLDEAITMALNLEAEVSNLEWNQQAAEDRARLTTPAAVIILDAFRDSSNVVPFPRGRA